MVEESQTEVRHGNATSAEKDRSTSNNATILWVTYANIVLYALCFQLQRPVEPFLIKSLSEQSGDSDSIAKTYGNLQSFFNTIQTVGSPLVGILLDRIGIRYTSAIVFLASAASYAILAAAYDMHTLFWSKVPTVLQAAFLVAQATAATSTAGNASARAAALGRMTTAYTIGATLGPAMGGYLADTGDFYVGAKLAVLGSLVSVLLSLAFLPNVTHQDEASKASSSSAANDGSGRTKKSRSFLDGLKHSASLVTRSNLWPLLMVKVLGGVTASMHSTALPLVLTEQLGFDPSELGVSMSGSMLAVAAFGAVGMAPLTNALGPRGMTNLGLVGRAMLGCVMALLVSTFGGKNTDWALIQIISVSIVHALASHALATGLTTQTTGSVQKDEQGALLGLEHGLFSLARIGGPSLGTALLQLGNGLWLVELTCGSMDILLLLALAASLSTKEKRKET